MTPENFTLTTPRGNWNLQELSNDVFGLLERASGKDNLFLSGDKTEEVVSAVLVAEGRIPVVYLGEVNYPTVQSINSETLWVFSTSGSTGMPKQIIHRLDAITRKTVSKHQSSNTWGFFYDITRMAGLQVVLEAISRGDNLVIPDLRMSMNQKLKFIREKGVTHLSATPSQYRQLLSTEGASALPLQQITLGGEIADQKLLDGLRSVFPASKITHVYATTETGPLLAVSDGLEGFPEAKFLELGHRILLSDSGEIGIVKTDGYNIHWTGDIVSFKSGRYKFIGRNANIINVGGAKVFPEAVESIILSHPDVSDCLVKGRANSIVGELVSVEVVLKKPNANIEQEVRMWSRKFLPDYAIPRFIEIVEAVLYSASGKKVRERK